MKCKLVIGILLALLCAPYSGAMNWVVAPWGSGYGQYGALYLPEGGRLGPQSLCVGDDGSVFVLDTFNGGRVIAYNAEGELIGMLANRFPSAGYAEIEAGRFLYLLDFSRSAVNTIDFETKAQSLRSAKVLGASGEIVLMGKDLRGKAFIRDSRGRDIPLDPQYKAPLLTLEVQDAEESQGTRVRWRNTRIAFPVGESEALQTVRFLGQLATGEIYLGVESRQDDLYSWQVSRYHPDGWKRDQHLRLPSSPPSALRYRKPVAVDKAGNVYQLLCSDDSVRIIKRAAQGGIPEIGTEPPGAAP